MFSEKETEAQLGMKVSNLPVKDKKLQIFKNKTQKDNELQKKISKNLRNI